MIAIRNSGWNSQLKLFFYTKINMEYNNEPDMIELNQKYGFAGLTGSRSRKKQWR
jgi:hypothetical protein